MDYAKDEIFDVTYQTKQNRLMGQKGKVISRIKHLCQKHKGLTFLLLSFLFFSAINIILITQFMRILQTLS